MRILDGKTWWNRWRKSASAPTESPSARGARAEAAAARYLRRQGYRILQQNLHLSQGEIDLLALHEGYLVIVEVRSYKAGNFPPRATLSPDKQRRLRRLAEQVHKPRACRDLPVRIDLVEVLTDKHNRPVGFEIIKAI